DAHASTNTTSVYTAAEVFPMLPERLSTDLTSLNAAEDRLAVIVDMTVGADGAVAGGEIYRAWVRNHAKLAYNALAAWLEGQAPLPPAAAVKGLDANLKRQDAIAQAMKARRHRRGSLGLRTLEARAVVELLGKGESAVARPGAEPAGRFALAGRDYTHATAPSRRCPDLVSQRLVKAALAGRGPAYGADELDALARHCTEQEDDAAKVERQVRKSAAALLLEHRLGEHFDALVTGAADKGTWVRIARPPA